MYDEPQYDPGLDAYDPGAFDASIEDAIASTAANSFNLELRAIYTLHGEMAAQMAQVQDDYVSFPPTLWQVTAVEVQPFKELSGRYAEHAVWGILDFVDQPGGAFAFVDHHAASIITGLGEEEIPSDDGLGYVEAYLQHFTQAFMACWQEIAQFDVQMFPSPTAPALAELQAMFPGLNTNTPLLVTAFRVAQPGASESGRVVLAIPQAYLLSVGPSLQAIGETTLGTNDTSHFHERLAYLEDVPVPLIVYLGKAEMTVGDLQGLEEGDVIALDSVAGLPLRVRLGNKWVEGKPGTSADGRRLAVQLSQFGGHGHGE